MLINGREPKPPVSQANAANFGALLTDLVKAYEDPSAEAEAAVEADLEAIGAAEPKDLALASAVADHWRATYLDPDYRLFFLGKDDPAAVGIPDSAEHAVVVLGYELADGEMQPELKARCDAAAALAEAFPHTILVCSGGATGDNNPDGHTEAGLMKEYLSRERGIESSRIFTDERAMTTAENAVNTFKTLKERKVRSMTIVTSGYHQLWGQALYSLLAEQYRQQHGWSMEIVGNYCCDVEPSVPIFTMGDRIAARQMAQILELPEDAIKDLPSFFPPRPEGAEQPPSEEQPAAA